MMVVVSEIPAVRESLTMLFDLAISGLSAVAAAMCETYVRLKTVPSSYFFTKFFQLATVLTARFVPP